MRRMGIDQDKTNIVQFAPYLKNSFYAVVTERVHAYFEHNQVSPYANTQMWIKTTVMFLLYVVPYILLVLNFAAGNVWLFFLLWFAMAWGMIGLGTSVMHDAHHGTYSPRHKINHIIGYILEVMGGYSVTWKIQHNLLHHTYTNITGLDEDIDTISLLRFSPRQPYYWYHRYQYLYAWFFYMFMTLFWMTAKDYLQVVRYRQHNLLARYGVSLKQAVFRITLYKMFYYTYIIVLPLLFSGMPWYYVIMGFLLMHFTVGLFLSCIFQPAHIMESSEFALRANGVEAEKTWAEHEMENTTDFAPRNRLLTWFVGGLNFQIEHHLFTRVCHVHLPKLAPIVKSTAKEFKVPYQVQPTFFKALREHAKMLKKLGQE